MQIKHPVILFDGVCNLCNATVNFLLKRDCKKQFRFAPLQSETGKKLILLFRLPENSDSVILINNDKAYFKSDAAFEIAGMLPYPWKTAIFLKVIPKKIRDKLYDWIAKNRYSWFGKRDTCRIPSEKEKEFFILHQNEL
jgi:predicted DCC family thiol-disulfide oxidoreductase YuxK